MKKIIFLALMGMLTLQSVNAQRKEGKNPYSRTNGGKT